MTSIRLHAPCFTFRGDLRSGGEVTQDRFGGKQVRDLEAE